MPGQVLLRHTKCPGAFQASYSRDWEIRPSLKGPQQPWRYRRIMTMTTMRRTRPKPPPIYIERSPFWSIEDPWTAASSRVNNAHHVRASQARKTTRVVLPAASRCRRRQGQGVRGSGIPPACRVVRIMTSLVADGCSSGMAAARHLPRRSDLRPRRRLGAIPLPHPCARSSPAPC